MSDNKENEKLGPKVMWAVETTENLNKLQGVRNQKVESKKVFFVYSETAGIAMERVRQRLLLTGVKDVKLNWARGLKGEFLP